MKEALGQATVLAVPNFDRKFGVETDASSQRIGVVLILEARPLAHISKNLGPRWQELSVYKNELLAIVHAVQKWKLYLMGTNFLIKTDQKSLKWSLEQKISTPFQQFLLSKLRRFDYEIQYKSGKENQVADALPRVSGSNVLLMAISVIDTNLESLIKTSYHLDNNVITDIEELQDQQRYAGFELKKGLLRKHNKIVIGRVTQLRHKFIY